MSMAALVRVDDDQIWVELKALPAVGATLDIGFPVVVIESRQVAGGGMLIAAQRVDHEVTTMRMTAETLRDEETRSRSRS